MIREISKFIEDLGLGPPWVIGTNMFAGRIPVKNFGGVMVNTLTRYLAVLENAGGVTLQDIGGDVTATPPSTEFPDYVEKAVQLLNRRDGYNTAYNDAKELYDALKATAGWNLPVVGAGPQYIACVIDAQGPPAPVELPGEAGLFTFSTNYIWKIEEASCGP
jgi:hypothetical protein